MPKLDVSTYQKFVFASSIEEGEKVINDVYYKGEGGKTVMIIQELPGIGQTTLALAERFIERGYRVILPHLFGKIGSTNTAANFIKVMCMRREFNLWAGNENSGIVLWLKALCRQLKIDFGVEKMAAIGMCLTGSFALSLIVEENVLATYNSQPSLPFINQKKLPYSKEEIQNIKESLKEKGAAHAARFKYDPLSRKAHFKALDLCFNSENNELLKLHTLKGVGHSILTGAYKDDEGHQTKVLFHEIVSYFDEQLKA